MTPGLSIQQMADETGVSPDTLRYYEKIGLIDPVARNESGHRRYGDKDLLRVNFLKRLRATGMQISQMQYYVELFRAGESTLVERRKILEQHRIKVLEQIDELYETVDLLDTKIASYLEQETHLEEYHD